MLRHHSTEIKTISDKNDCKPHEFLLWPKEKKKEKKKEEEMTISPAAERVLDEQESGLFSSPGLLSV